MRRWGRGVRRDAYLSLRLRWLPLRLLLLQILSLPLSGSWTGCGVVSSPSLSNPLLSSLLVPLRQWVWARRKHAHLSTAIHPTSIPTAPFPST